MVLVNLTPNTLDGDLHSVPTVHVDPPASTAITAYAATAGATATLTEGNETSTDLAYPQIAAFSSRGPSVGTGGDTLKPDLVAPGVSILGATAPPRNDGQDFGFLSGTSESAPQVAGLAALWFGAGVRPTWSPMNVKSALMTTAADLVDGSGKKVADPFAQGAGRVVPDRMFAPGLVYPAGQRDWLGYLEGLGMDTSSRTKAIDPSDYNSPSIAIGQAGGQADRDPSGDRRGGRTLPGHRPGPRRRRRRPSVGAGLQPRRADPDVPGHVHPDHGELRQGRDRVLDLEGPSGGAYASRWPSPRGPSRRRSRSPARDRRAGCGSASPPARPGPSQRSRAVWPPAARRPGRWRLIGPSPIASVPPPARRRHVSRSARPTPAPISTCTSTSTTRTPWPGWSGSRPARRSSESFVVAKPSSSDSTSDLPVAGDYALQVVNAGNAPGTTATSFTAQTGLVQATGGEGSFTVEPSRTEAHAGETVRADRRLVGRGGGGALCGLGRVPRRAGHGRHGQLRPTRPGSGR